MDLLIYLNLAKLPIEYENGLLKSFVDGVAAQTTAQLPVTRGRYGWIRFL